MGFQVGQVGQVDVVIWGVLHIREVEDGDSPARVDAHGGVAVRAGIIPGLDAGSEGVVVKPRRGGRHAHSTPDHSIQSIPPSAQLGRCGK